MGSRVKRSELWSVLIFVVGITVGIAGTTLAIIFGVQNSKPCSCDKVNAELFSSQVGIKKSYMSWNDDFKNQSSPQYLFAVQNLSAALTSALTSGTIINRRMFAALPTGTSASVQVAQLRQGEDGSIICFAYGTVYGSVDTSELPSYSTIQSQIDSTTSLATGATVDAVSSPENSPCNVTYGSTTTASLTTTTPEVTVSKNRLTTQITTSSTRKVATSPTLSTKPATSTITTKPGIITSTTTISTSTTTQKITTPSTGPTQTSSSRISTSTSASTSANFSSSPTGNSTSTAGISLSTTQANTSSTSVSPTTSRISVNSSSTPKPSSTSPLASSPSSSTTKSSTTGSSTISSTKITSSGTSTGIPSTSPTRFTTAEKTTVSNSGSTTPPSTTGSTSTVNNANTTTAKSTPSLPTQFTSNSVPSTSTSTVSTPISQTSTSTVSAPKSSTSTSTVSAPMSSTSTSTISTPISSSSTSTVPTPTSTVSTSVTTMQEFSTSQSTSTMKTTVASTTQSSPSPTTSTTLRSTTPMTTSTVTPCTGVKKYMGDIAVAFELTTNTSQAAIENFVTTLLTYANNPYSFTPDAITNAIPTAYMLAPYPQTESYPTSSYGQGIDNIGILLNSFNTILSAVKQYKAEMLDALNFIETTTNLHPMQRTIVLVGVSDSFVDDALGAASTMKKQGFEIFTVNMGMGNLSPLATDSNHTYNVNNDTDEVEVATRIGNRLLGKSSVCFHAQKPITTTAQTHSTSTYTLLHTTSSCNAAIKQDIAFVVELSTSTGNLDASQVARKFITNYLMDSHFDDEHSNYAIVPFPDPSSYAGIAPTDFLSLHKYDINTTFSALFTVFPYVKGDISDIKSGLNYAQDHEFPLVSSDSLPKTVLLFANSADGVDAAKEVASNLTSTGRNILTVAVGGKASDLSALASDPKYCWNLPVSSEDSYTQLAGEIISQLLQLGKVCR